MIHGSVRAFPLPTSRRVYLRFQHFFDKAVDGVSWLGGRVFISSRVVSSLVFVESCVDCGCGQGGVEWSRQSKSCLGSVPVSTQLNSALFCRLDFKLDLLSSSSSDCCSHSHPDQSDHLILLLISHRSSGPRIEKLEWDKSFPSHIKA